MALVPAGTVAATGQRAAACSNHRCPTRICTQLVFAGGTCSSTNAAESQQLGGCTRAHGSFDVYNARARVGRIGG